MTLSTFCRPFAVRAYRQHAGTIEFRDGRYLIWGPDGDYWGTRSTREAAAYVLEQNMLGEIYQPPPLDPAWSEWPETFPETKTKPVRRHGC